MAGYEPLRGSSSYPFHQQNLQPPPVAHQHSYASNSPSARSREASPYRDSRSASADRLLGEDQYHNASPALGSTVPGGARTLTAEILTDNPELATDVSLFKFIPHRFSKEDKLDPLKWRPLILRDQSLWALILLYLLVALAIGILFWRSGSDREFHLSSENVRMISRYFPSILGTITTIFFRLTIREYIRMTPYINMADQKGHGDGEKPWKSVGGAFFPWQNIMTTPGFMSFFSLLCSFIASFIVSLKVALFASSSVDGIWTLTFRDYPGLFLIVGYACMASYTLLVLFRLRGKSTGLRWDPVSIADFVALFAQCNALQFFKGLELQHHARPKQIMSQREHFRLGYWDRVVEGDPKKETVYGIGVCYSREDEEGGLPVQAEQPEPRITHGRLNPLPMHDHIGQGCAYGRWPRCEHYPYLRSPGVSRKEIVSFTILTWAALAGLIFLAVRGYMFKENALANTLHVSGRLPPISIGNSTHQFGPVDPADPDANLLVYALLFRSLPTYFTGFYTNWIIEAIDLNMRFIQPFRNMFETPGEAADTILLAYLSLSPLQVPLTALHKKHWKVMVYSTINTFSPLFPIFVGGLVSLSGDASTVYVTFSLSACIGAFVSLILFSVAVPYSYPFSHKGRLLPRQFYSIADLMAMCYDARFMAGPNFDISKPEKTPNKEIFEARILLSGEKFLFGRYIGRKGDYHLGFDCCAYREGSYGVLQEHQEWVKWFPAKSRFSSSPSTRREIVVADRSPSPAAQTTGAAYGPRYAHYYSHMKKRPARHQRLSSDGPGLGRDGGGEAYMMSGGFSLNHDAMAAGFSQAPVGLGLGQDARPSPSFYRDHRHNS